MSNLVVFIEDKIRDKRVRVKLNLDRPVGKIIHRLVELLELPRCDFDLSPVNYRLLRAVDETCLPGDPGVWLNR